MGVLYDSFDESCKLFSLNTQIQIKGEKETRLIDEVKTEPLNDDQGNSRKMNTKYDNLYLFDTTTRIWVCASCGATYQSDHGTRSGVT